MEIIQIKNKSKIKLLLLLKQQIQVVTQNKVSM